MADETADKLIVIHGQNALSAGNLLEYGKCFCVWQDYIFNLGGLFIRCSLENGYVACSQNFIVYRCRNRPDNWFVYPLYRSLACVSIDGL